MQREEYHSFDRAHPITTPIKLQGLPEGDVRDAYPGVMEDLKAMVRAGDVIALKVCEECARGVWW